MVSSWSMVVQILRFLDSLDVLEIVKVTVGD